MKVKFSGTFSEVDKDLSTMFIASFVVSLMFVVDCFYIIHNGKKIIKEVSLKLWMFLDLLEQKKPEEVQHAVCQIFTKDFEATANATITRQLKGVCTSGNNNEKPYFKN